LVSDRNLLARDLRLLGAHDRDLARLERVPHRLELGLRVNTSNVSPSVFTSSAPSSASSIQRVLGDALLSITIRPRA